MVNSGLDFCHVTQTGFFITVKGTEDTTVIFCGDRWSDFAGNGIGYNQWCPVTFNGTTPVFNSLSQWSLDAVKGTWRVGPGNNYILNPGFEADRVLQTSLAGWSGAKNASGSRYSVILPSSDRERNCFTEYFQHSHRYLRIKGMGAEQRRPEYL